MPGVVKISDAFSLALHTLVLLAANGERLVSVKEAARRFQVSEAHLAKVLQRLARAGLVRSFRGPGGGFRLIRPARETSLLQIYEAIDGPLDTNGCLLGNRPCGLPTCLLGRPLEEINTRVRDHFSMTNLADLSQAFGRKK